MANQDRVKVSCPTGSYPISMQSPVNYNKQRLLAVIKVANLVQLFRTQTEVYNRMTMTMIKRIWMVTVLQLQPTEQISTGNQFRYLLVDKQQAEVVVPMMPKASKRFSLMAAL